MARLADDAGTGTRRTLPTPKPIVDERTQRQAMTLTPAQLSAIQAQAEAAQAQTEAATALAAAKANAEKVATQIGAKVDPNTGKIDVTTIPKTPSGKTVNSVTYEGAGKDRVKVTKYSDGSETREASPEQTGGGKKVVSTYTDPQTGDIINVYDDQSEAVVRKGTKALDAQRAAADAAAAKEAKGKSAFAVFRSFLDQYGIGALAADVEKYKLEGLSDQELLMRLRTESTAYKNRFAANEERIKKGLRALSEAEYVGLEDAYQEKMRQYGLPASYYAKGDMGRQQGFEKLIAGGVAPTELEDRLQTAYDRVINAAPEVSQALKQFYPDINNGDVLAFVLDPENARDVIKRKVSAAEIGGAAMAEGLATGLTRAEELQRFGVTGAAYRQAAPYIKQAAERGSQLAGFYDQGQFDQTTAEQAALGISGSAEAQKKIKKLTQLEQASFSGQAGAAKGALARERAGQF